MILLVGTVLTLVAGVFAAKLEVDSDLRALLPKDHAVVRSLERIESTFGSTNSVNIVAKGGTIEQRHAFTDALEERLAAHPLFRDVEHGLPSRFFAERALYYLSDAEMDELEERIDAWTHFKLCSATPDACLTDPDPEAQTKLRAFIEDKRERSWERTGFRERYERDGIEAEVLLAHPHEPANQLDVAREVTDEVRALATEVYERPGAAWAGGAMTYNIIGPYVVKADEQATVLRDMARSGAFAFIGVVAILYFLFRSHRAVLVLLVPLLCGVAWSLAATQLVLGHLNVMTSTISTVVMGVGIDAGIHFFSRAKRARLEHDDGEAIRRAFDGLVVPLLVASSTTIGAFASMASSDFPAFREFGIIAALGVALCLLSMVTMLPALCYLVGIKKRKAKRRGGEYGLATRLVLARPGLLFIVLVGVTVAALQGARQVRFEYNGRELQSDHARQNSQPDAQLISDVFGKDIHASVLVRPTLEEARETLDRARARHAARQAEGTTVVAELFGAPDLLPDPGLDMEARAARIAALEREHDTLIDQLREHAGLPPREPVPAQEADAPEDGGDWDDWDDGDEPTDEAAADDGAGGDEAGGDEAADDEAPGEAVEVGEDWDDWDGSEDEDDGEPEGDAPAPAKGDAPATDDAADGDAAAKGDAADGDAAEDEAPAKGDAPATDDAADGDAAEDEAPAKAAAEGDAKADPAAVGEDWDDWDGSEDEADEADEPADEPEEAAAETAEPTTATEPATEDGEGELTEEDAELLLAMFEARPFTVDDLPPVLLNKVRASDGSFGLFAYPAFDVADMEQGMVFMEETSSYLDDTDDTIFVGEAVVYAAMFLMLREEAPVVLGMAAVLIAVLVFWQLRSLALMLMTLVPLMIAMLWLLGLMGAIDLRFTLFNLPILPAILGIGVDNAVYLTDRIRRSPSTDEGLAQALQETGGAILAATATTAVGFAAFMVADSGGVRGIGSLAVAGILLAATAALLVLPTATALVQRRQRQ